MGGGEGGKGREICTKMHAEGATLLHDWHHKVSSPIKVHQNTRYSATHEAI